MGDYDPAQIRFSGTGWFIKRNKVKDPEENLGG
jgi:hypothetical protein